MIFKLRYAVLNGEMAMNYELERMWKGKGMAFFKMMSHHLPEGTEENHRKRL
jgi:hypothetical protein